MTAERKVLLLLHTPHKRGFERLRLSAGISPSGLHWRYKIAPAVSFNPDGATLKHELYARGAFASSNGKSAPFDWEGAQPLETTLSRIFATCPLQGRPAPRRAR